MEQWLVKKKGNCLTFLLEKLKPLNRKLSRICEYAYCSTVDERIRCSSWKKYQPVPPRTATDSHWACTGCEDNCNILIIEAISRQVEEILHAAQAKWPNGH